MTNKYALQKGTAILGTGLVIISMGSCAKKTDNPIIVPVTETTQEEQLTEKELETTTFSIFEDPDTIELPTTEQPETTIPEKFTSEKKEEITTTSPVKTEGYYSRFTNQQQLETYLEQIYNESFTNLSKNSTNLSLNSSTVDKFSSFISCRNSLIIVSKGTL